jgi:hypothetical protein
VNDPVSLCTGVQMVYFSRTRDPGRSFAGVSYEHLDPVGMVRGIYHHYGLAWPGTFEERLRAYVRENTKGRHGPHRYAATDFGQTDAGIAERFANYRERFGFASPGMPHD